MAPRFRGRPDARAFHMWLRPRRKSGAGRAARTAASRAITCLALLAALVACGSEEDSKTQPLDPAPYTETHEVSAQDVTTSASGAVDVKATIPEDSRAIGIVVIGTDTEWKFIEHEGVILDQGGNIRGPDGPVAYSYDIINDQNAPSAINNEEAALHFPNQGLNVTMPDGTYYFPAGAACDKDTSTPCDGDPGELYSDELETVVYYKTVTSEQPVLPLNIVVLDGVNPEIVDADSAEADAEIAGAITVLMNTFEENNLTGLDVELTVAHSGGCGFDATPDVLDDPAETLCLAASFPAEPADDAVNLYVISSIAYLEENVVGLDPGIPGPFRLQGLVTSGPVAEYQGDGDGTMLGYVLAHELGHYLGLFHTSQTNNDKDGIIGYDPISDTSKCTDSQVASKGDVDNCPDRDNLMFPYACDPEPGHDCDDPDLTTGQGNVIRYNPAVTP